MSALHVAAVGDAAGFRAGGAQALSAVTVVAGRNDRQALPEQQVAVGEVHELISLKFLK